MIPLATPRIRRHPLRWEPLTDPIPVRAPSYCTRPEWSSPGESIWMRLAKFAWCNRLPHRSLVRLFAPSQLKGLRFDPDMRSAGPFRMAALAQHLAISPGEVRRGFCVDDESAPHPLASSELRYCPICLSLGFHSSLYQWPFIAHCPIHRAPLQGGCPNCGKPIGYRLNAALALSPLRCVGCKTAWVPALDRPTGRCRPLLRSYTRKLALWQEYVRRAVGSGGTKRTYARDRHGRYLTDAESGHTRAALQRFDYITMLNTLYPVPPDGSVIRAQGSADILPEVHPGAVDRWASRRKKPAWRRCDWLGYNRFFIHLEALVEEFFRHDHHVSRQRRSQILEHLRRGPILPAETLTEAEVVAVGGRLSWFGIADPARTFQRPRRPAFGLAAWLAHGPPQPFNLDRDEWQRQVEAWLWEDLRRSVVIWQNIARFMRGHRHYLLHPALVPPARLAGRHEVKSTEFMSIH